MKATALFKDDFARLKRLDADGGVQGLAQNLLRRARSDLFDLDAAFAAGHQGGPATIAIDDLAEIQLARDVARLFDEHAAHLTPTWAGLMGDELRAEQAAGKRVHLLGRFADPHATGLAASARVDLCLDDTGRGELPSDRGCLVGMCRNPAAGHGDAVASQQFFRLELVNVHLASAANPRAGP
jgi:hypothetical protein